MTGQFIISLDCEGKWGTADGVGPQHDCITESSLNKVYQDLLELFEEFEVKATFAFVGAFTLRPNERGHYIEQISETLYRDKPWATAATKAVRAGSVDGWFCPDAFDRVMDTNHEIACHGFSHIPYDDPATPRRELEKDIALAIEVAKSRGVDLRTFVYPRNRIAHTDLLGQHGFVGYRGYVGGGRLRSIVRECNPLQTAHTVTPGNRDNICEIPSGHFLNWKSGLRSAIPDVVTRKRWRSILKSAVATEGLAHIWLHPHNLITAPATAINLRQILSMVREFRELGDIESVSQREFVESVHSAPLTRTYAADNAVEILPASS